MIAELRTLKSYARQSRLHHPLKIWIDRSIRKLLRGAFRFAPFLAGLYLKLYGTHRHNSLKKRVISKHRNDTGGGNIKGRISDQAAVEALVFVGRLGVSLDETGNDEGAEADQHKILVVNLVLIDVR